MSEQLSLRTWIAAARLRTLPLALATILLGSLLAAYTHAFSGKILFWSMLTAVFYQILSNFANDLGDGLKGTDDNRVGEAWAIASGAISIKQMKWAVFMFVVLSVGAGTYLSVIATATLPGWVTGLFIGLGIMATIAALSYTMGKRAYGYSGYGDLFVLIFFGWVGVIGSNFLQTNSFQWNLILPASAVGFLAMGVLNLNNMRDVESDSAAGKNTVVVKRGLAWAKAYHHILLYGAVLLQLAYVWLTSPGFGGYLFLAILPLILNNLSRVRAAKTARDFEPLLKPLAITTLLFCLLAGIGQNLKSIIIIIHSWF